MRRSAPTAFAARRESRGPRRGIFRWAVLALGGPLLAAAPLAALPTANTLGLPFTRSYSFEEIGDAARGARLGFDEVGRIAVMSGGSYAVLNDTTWMDIADRETEGPELQVVAFGPDGHGYYGSFGSWGLVEPGPRGLLRPRPLRQADGPKWLQGLGIAEIMPVPGGVFFAGFGGVVHWDRATGKQSYFEVPEVTQIFALAGRIFVGSHSQGIVELDVAHQATRVVARLDSDVTWIDQATVLGADRVLLSDNTGRLLVFDGKTLGPWTGPLAGRPIGRVTALTSLPDGSAALGIAEHGLYLVSAEGEIISAYTTPEYRRIIDLAAREPGVLWVSTESGIEKVLYQNPLTVFGQRLGLPVSWPQITRWRDRIVVASAGRLYETVPDTHPADGGLQETKLFQLVAGQPPEEIWGLAARGDQLLIGNSAGVMVREPDGRFTRVLDNISVARLVMPTDDLCYVIGVREVTALRYRAGRWREFAPRIAGVGYPLIVHSGKESAWIELGADRTARLSVDGDRLALRLFEHFPWPTPRWVNVSVVGDIAIMGGVPNWRLFFDEKKGEFTDAPALGKLLDDTPAPIRRVKEDRDGTVWAVYDHGVMRFDPDGRGGYRRNPARFGRIKERFPNIQLLPGGDVWLTAGQSLYHVDPRFALVDTATITPRVVSIAAGRTHRELLASASAAPARPVLPYAENSLVLRFFAGSYASRQALEYDFRLERGNSTWTPVGNGSVLTLTDLHEGSYRLEARATEARQPIGRPVAIEFEILAPWYRTRLAYALYALGSLALVVGVTRWFNRRARTQYLALEKIVAARTEELRAAMQQLNIETRNAATVAERDRLAGEIHDSLQQGLSGLMLHLDATLKLPELSDDVRSRLSVARNMVSFTRHEVQHAVWDMETPLLEGTELGDALRKITSLIAPGETHVEITVNGPPANLSPSTKHHLLRIAQEAITNAVRHSAARTIAITLDYEENAVVLSITDDGNGFVPHDVLNKGLGHFGLRGLRGRAGKIGGELQIDSAPGRGTTVRIRVQLPNPSYAHADRP
jgi:signal transduction histidine kinase